MNIRISHTEANATPRVVKALAELKCSGGGELHFEAGEYHFYREGTEVGFFAVSNNTANDKYTVFPIVDMENVTVDGHGSVFVFHETVFPFMISRSKGVTVKNMTFDIGMSPLVDFKIHGRTDEGFYMDIDRGASPFFVENGAVYFKRETGTWDGGKYLLSLHAVNRHQVQYLATGICANRDFEGLPAPLMKCDVTETPDGIYAKYRADTPSRCGFGDEPLSAIIDGGRNVDLICLDRSENVTVKDVTVARGIGMGVIGQLSKNITVDGFSTVSERRRSGQHTLTADALHFVNCDGALEIKNCIISDTMDDALNVHGMYTVLSNVADGCVRVSIMHREQYYFNPYRYGDRLELIDPETLEIVAEFIVDNAILNEESGREIELSGRFMYGAENARYGFLVENPDRMPCLHMHHNTFDRFPHNRISGAGEMIVEENCFSNCHAALLCLDLARYWYESGRVKHLVYRNNLLTNCDTQGSGAFIKIGIDGVPDESAPRIHGRIEITGNSFSQIKGLAIKSGGVRELIIEDNKFDTEKRDVIVIN